MATVDLSWTDNSSKEDGFYIYRTTTSSPSFPTDYTQIDSVGTDVTTYTDSTVSSATTYYYAVTAYNTNGESSETTDSVTTPNELTVTSTDRDTATVTSSRLRTFTTGATDFGTVATTTSRFQQIGLTPTDFDTVSADVFDPSVQSVRGVDTGWLTAPTSTGTLSVTTGFKPDLVMVTASNTNTSSDTGSEVSETNDHGWCHGAAEFASGTQHAVFSGSGSNSTNGQTTEIDETRLINVLELADDGTTITNRIQATAQQDIDGFTLDFTQTGEAEQIQYRAYEFDDKSGVDIDFLEAPTSTTTQSISTSVAPDFVKFCGQPRATLANQTVDDSADHGISHGWLTRDTQYALSFASTSTNVDDHVWGARNDSCLLVKHEDTKGGVTGTTEATGTLTDTGFDLNYSSVDGAGEAILYVAIEADEEFTVTSVNAPTAPTTSTVAGNFRDINLVGNATIDSLNVDGYSGSNQTAISYGYTHGVGTETTDQTVLSVGVSSNSVNAHRHYAASGELGRLLFTDDNANDDGSDDATLSVVRDSEIDVEFTAASDSGSEDVASSHDTNPMVLWGVKKPDYYDNLLSLAFADIDSQSTTTSRLRTFTSGVTDFDTASATPSRLRTFTTGATDFDAASITTSRIRNPLSTPTDFETVTSTPSRFQQISLTPTDFDTVTATPERVRVPLSSTVDTDGVTTTTSRKLSLVASPTDFDDLSGSFSTSFFLESLSTDHDTLSVTPSRIRIPLSTPTDTDTVSSETSRIRIPLSTSTDTDTVSSEPFRRRTVSLGATDTDTVSSETSRIRIPLSSMADDDTLTAKPFRLREVSFGAIDTDTIATEVVFLLPIFYTDSDTGETKRVQDVIINGTSIEAVYIED